MKRTFKCLCLAVLCWLGVAHAAAPESPRPEQAPAVRSADAERIFEESRPRLLQIRTLTRAGGSQYVIGSGFLVAPDLAVTNFHVVSEWISASARYQLEWVSTNNLRGPLDVLAIDLAHDLAVVRLKGSIPPHSPYKLAADEPHRGERVFSLGRPLDLGFNIVEGTHNGLVEGDFREQYHFSGAINAGMSGGPAVNQAGEVFGINVARNLRGDLISYLVPARFAQTLLEHLPPTPPSADALRKAMSQQLSARQSLLLGKLFAQALPTRKFGSFSINAEQAPLLKCWSAAEAPKPTRNYAKETMSCEVDADLFLGSNLSAGSVNIEHVRVHSAAFSRLRFDALVSSLYELPGTWMPASQAGKERCDDQFVRLGEHSWRVASCLRTLNRFDGMYQLRLVAVSMDRREPDKQGERQALSSRLAITASSFTDITLATRRFLEALR